MKFCAVLLILPVLLSCSSLGKRESIDLPSYREFKLDNGLVVLLFEDQSLPYVSYMMMVRSGSVSDPEGAEGLAALVGDLLDQGTAQRNAIQLADSLGQMGARLNVSTGNEYTLISASGLSFHKDQLLKDFTEVITQPSFPTKEVNRVKAQRLSQLKQTVDDPDSLADVAFDQYLFGTHPYGRRVLGSLTDVQKIRKKNIIRYYLEHFRPNNSYLAVVGKFEPAEMKSKVEAAFKNWENRKVEAPVYGSAPNVEGLQIQLVDKGDLKQAQIRFGHIGIERTHPDYLKLRLANTILGGAFASRLMQEIREERGLTYSISSGFQAYSQPGPFLVSTFTRHDKIQETVETTLSVLKEFADKGVTKQEVAEAKEFMIGTFPRSLETPEAVASAILMLRHYGLDESYLENFVSDLRDLSAEDVNEAIRKHLHPENIKVLVYAPKSKAQAQLKKIGPVETKSYREFL